MSTVIITADSSHNFKYYDTLAMMTVVMWMISVVIAQKIVTIGGFVVSISVATFPLSYLLSDIMTEVYGYARARRVTWMTVIGMGLMFLAFKASVAATPSALWQGQEAFAKTLGYSGRVIAASLIGLFTGEMTKAFVQSKMKQFTNGEQLWMRTISSTFIAQGLGLMVFYVIAFAGVLSIDAITVAIFSLWFLKTVYEAVMTPVTYFIINRLKKIEGVDIYDTHTEYTPFAYRLKTTTQEKTISHAAANDVRAKADAKPRKIVHEKFN